MSVCLVCGGVLATDCWFCEGRANQMPVMPVEPDVAGASLVTFVVGAVSGAALSVAVLVAGYFIATLWL